WGQVGLSGRHDALEPGTAVRVEEDGELALRSAAVRPQQRGSDLAPAGLQERDGRSDRGYGRIGPDGTNDIWPSADGHLGAVAVHRRRDHHHDVAPGRPVVNAGTLGQPG